MRNASGRFQIILALAIIPAVACRPAATREPMPEWQYEMARTPARWLQIPEVRLLQDYVRIDTTNPPGRERAGAEFLKSYLDCEGIASELICPAANRCNLYARIAGKQHGNGLVLLNHIDVVPAYAPYWTKPPFGGVIEKSYLYGRGSYDMKSIAISQLLAFVDLAHSGVRPNRDVILLAECDEEWDGRAGVAWLYQHRPELLDGVTCVLNEGGYIEIVAGELRFWGIEIGQGGSGAVLLAADDPAALSFPNPYEDFNLNLMPDRLVRMYLNAVAEYRSPIFANAFRHPELLRDQAFKKLIPFQNLSLIEGGVSRLPPFQGNLIPAFDFGKKWDAPLAVSLPLGVDPAPYLDREVAKAAAKGAIAVFRRLTPPGSASPFPTPDTDAIGRVLAALHPGITVLPLINSFSDTTSVEFRRRGIPAYGLSPFQVDPADESRRHGQDERIFLPFYTRGVAAMREILFEMSAQEPPKFDTNFGAGNEILSDRVSPAR